MAIDLPSSTQISLRGSQNSLATAMGQRQDALQAALSALNIKQGDTAAAVVKAVNAVDDRLRARLVTLANPVAESASANSARTTANAAAGAARSADNLASLLQSPLLKLVQVEVKGHNLLTFTDQPLKAGSQILLQAQRGRLVLLPGPAANADSGNKTTAAATSQPATTQAAITQAATARSANAQAAAGTDNSATANFPAGRQSNIGSQQLSALQQELRSLLPKLEGGNRAVGEALASASMLAALLAQPANTSLRLQLPRSLQDNLQQLAAQLRNSQQLAQPATLKQALANSGLQLEQRLAQQFAGVDAGNSAKIAGGATQPSALGALAGHDIKAGLLLLSAQLAGIVPAAAGEHQALPQTLYSLLKKFSSRADGSGSLAQQLPREQLLQQLQQQVNQALDKVLLQQLQSLQRGLSSADHNALQHWQLDLPLRHGDGVHNLHMRIDEDWVHDYSDNNTAAPQKIRQWLVKLAFDLPDAGALHAHLVVVDTSVSASIWAEQARTLEQTRQQLGGLRSRLEHDGVTVKSIECFAGRPAADGIRLNYSLVDITT